MVAKTKINLRKNKKLWWLIGIVSRLVIIWCDFQPTATLHWLISSLTVTTVNAFAATIPFSLHRWNMMVQGSTRPMIWDSKRLISKDGMQDPPEIQNFKNWLKFAYFIDHLAGVITVQYKKPEIRTSSASSTGVIQRGSWNSICIIT